MPPDATTSVGIVDYGLGNLRSVAGAVERMGGRAVISGDPGALAETGRLILPGVGAFGDGMAKLRERGLVDALDRLVRREGRPLLGICLGAQLLCRDSDEFGHHEGFGWIDAPVRRLQPADPALKLPHVGWDDFERVGECPLFAEVPDGGLFYYVHSHAIEDCDAPWVAGRCTYGQRFVAAFCDGHIFGAQFHPEKSQSHGLSVIGSFLQVESAVAA